MDAPKDWKERLLREQALREAAEELAEDRRLAIHRIEVQMRALHMEVERLSKEPSLVPRDEPKTGTGKQRAAFVASMGHGLRTPLNAIIGYSEMLAEEAADTGETKAVTDLGKITESGRWLLSQINDLIHFSRLEAGRLSAHVERFNMPVMIEDLVHTLQPTLTSRRNVLDVSVGDEVAALVADAGKIRTCIRHVLTLAARSTESGSIQLDVSLDYDQHSDWMTVRIRDDGRGLTDDEQERLFEPFAGGDNPVSGLGLALAKGLLGVLGGSIELESRVGRGTTAMLRIPVQVPPPTRTEGHLLVGAEASILLVDDDPSVHDMLRRHLDKAGYSVITADDGAVALDLARSEQPDAILLDVTMPGMSGWTVLAALKADSDTEHIPVIICSFVDDESRGFSLGASDYLTKPVRRTTLLDAVAKHRRHTASQILVVDDDETTRSLLARMLQRGGWEVSTASNGREALTRLTEMHPDAIVLDLMMPVMDGFEFLQHLQRTEQWEDVPVVVITAMDLGDVEKRGLVGRVTKVMQKGAYSGDDLLSELQRRILVSRHRSATGNNP